MHRQFGALSGLAILLIVLNHSIELGINYPQELGYPAIPVWENNLLTIFQALGVFAVPTFLCISGSFVSYAAKGNPPTLSLKFLISSLRHILFPYVVWSLMFYVFVYFQRHQVYSISGYIKNLLVGYPYYFVPLLAFYYLISPLLVRIGKRFGLLILLVIGVYQFVLLIVVYPEVFTNNFPDWFRYLAPPVLRTTLASWAIYFPLGVMFGLNPKFYTVTSKQLVWLIGAVTLIIYLLGLLDAFKVISAPMARFICPVPFMFVIFTWKRDSIPMVRLLERVGRRSYGIYLTHLIILTFVMMILELWVSWIFKFPVVLSLLLFVIGSLAPLFIMEYVATGPTKRIYRYLFG